MYVSCRVADTAPEAVRHRRIGMVCSAPDRRRVRATQRFLAAAQKIMSALQEAEEALMPQSDEVCGVLRIGCMHYNTSAEIDRLFALLDDMPH